MLNEILLDFIDDIVIHYGLQDKKAEGEFYEYALDYIRESRE